MKRADQVEHTLVDGLVSVVAAPKRGNRLGRVEADERADLPPVLVHRLAANQDLLPNGVAEHGGVEDAGRQAHLLLVAPEERHRLLRRYDAPKVEDNGLDHGGLLAYVPHVVGLTEVACGGPASLDSARAGRGVISIICWVLPRAQSASSSSWRSASLASAGEGSCFASS